MLKPFRSAAASAARRFTPKGRFVPARVSSTFAEPVAVPEVASYTPETIYTDAYAAAQMAAPIPLTPEEEAAKAADDLAQWSTIGAPTGKKPALAFYDPVREPVIEPVWAMKQPEDVINPGKYEVDCAGYDMSAEVLPEAIVKEMREKYHATGLVYLRNTGMTKLTDMQRWVAVIHEENMTYQGGANSRGALDFNIYDTGAPKDAHLHYHHEMAYVSKSVTSVGFCCSGATEGKGWMYVSDNVGVTKDMEESELGRKLKEKGICYVRCLTDKEAFRGREVGWNGEDEYGVYNHWQRSFGVETQEEVEVLANSRGLIVEWGENRYCKTRYYTDAYEYFPEHDVNHFYASVADDAMWFDSWPGVKDLPTMPSYEEATQNERPLKITYGDDTEFTREELQEFVDVYDRNGIPLKWSTGDVAVMCNYRWSHGRPAYSLAEGEERTLGVALGPMFDRVGQKAGKWMPKDF